MRAICVHLQEKLKDRMDHFIQRYNQTPNNSKISITMIVSKGITQYLNQEEPKLLKQRRQEKYPDFDLELKEEEIKIKE